MSYDSMRTELISKMTEKYPVDLINDILTSLDIVAAGYEIERKEMGLSIIGDSPEIVKIYVASKAVEHLSMGTLKLYKLRLDNFFKTVRKSFADITTNDVRVYLFNYKAQRNISDHTLESMRMCFNSFFQWLVEEEYITRNPVRKISTIKFQPSERHAMSPLELEKLRSLCKSKREKAIVDFLYSTGCRVSELCHAKKNDVNWADRTFHVVCGKGGKSRTTYLNAECIISLKEYLASRNDDDDHLFTTERRPFNGFGNKAVENLLNDIVSRSPDSFVTHITPHVFRHTSATIALRNGMPIEQVQRFLGHSKVATTLIYAATDDSMVKSSHQRCVS